MLFIVKKNMEMYSYYGICQYWFRLFKAVVACSGFGTFRAAQRLMQTYF
jgi:hypothetical protein